MTMVCFNSKSCAFSLQKAIMLVHFGSNSFIFILQIYIDSRKQS